MSVPMKKLHTKKMLAFSWRGNSYSIPLNIIEKYKMPDANTENELQTADVVFKDLIAKFGEPALLLQGLRIREGLSQVEFAKIIGVTQQNLSAMENGRRNIGKDIAKRIAKKFGLDYRLFL